MALDAERFAAEAGSLLFTHSGRRCFAARLNSSVRPLMKLANTFLIAVFPLIPGCATYPSSDTTTLTGHFSYLDTSLPGCGTVAWASKATFVADTSGKNVHLAVPCVEMFFAESATGEDGLLKVGERYTIVLTREKPVPDMTSPFILNKKPWYLSSASQ